MKICKICEKEFTATRFQGAKKYCSEECAEAGKKLSVEKFFKNNPEKKKQYRENRIIKNPEYWQERAEKQRLEIIEILGGSCVICGVTNRYWLHADYIPTSKSLGYRHPRHVAFVRKNIKNFRLLCANHHYELTLTGKIQDEAS